MPQDFPIFIEVLSFKHRQILNASKCIVFKTNKAISNKSINAFDLWIFYYLKKTSSLEKLKHILQNKQNNICDHSKIFYWNKYVQIWIVSCYDSTIISKWMMCQYMNLICDQIHCHEDIFGKVTIHQMHFLVFVRANFVGWALYFNTRSMYDDSLKRREASHNVYL